MAKHNETSILRMITSEERHKRYLAILACLSMVVILGTALSLRQSGVAKTHEETVLDCHYAGAGAHTHTSDCYDASGELVCPLPEVELHVHDDSCYTETRELVCGIEEGEGAHTHTHECYDEEGNLVCELEESEGHVHTDECYETMRELTCGKEEVTEEHVHGPGCFQTITVTDPEPEAESTDVEATAASDTVEESDAEATANADEPMPAVIFDDDLKDAEDKVVLHVHVEAPEGAFPEGTTMRIKPVDANDIQGAVDDAMAQKTDAKVMDIQAVDITFYNKDEQEIEPATNITVALTSDLIAQNDDSYIVHVDDKGQGDVVDTLDERQIIEHELAPEDNQVVFDVDKFSTYTIVITSLHGTLNASDGNAYNIDVDVPAAAGIPQGAMLEAREITEGDAEYEAYLAEAGNAFENELAYARFFDISIVKDGQKVQPEQPVQVKISLLGEAENLTEDLKVLHFADDGGVAEQVDAALDGETVSFDANGFSVYAVVGEGDTTAHARMAVNFYGKNQTTPIATMYVKNGDTLAELEDILYDPGVGQLGDREVFKGWTTNPDYTVADGDNSLDIERIRELAENEQITEGMDPVNYYAIILKTFTASYKDSDGVTLGSQNAYARYDDPRTEYTVNMPYTPDDTHIFEGWNVIEGSSNIEGYTEGNTYTNGTPITIRGDVTFSVKAPEGHWLVFDENGKGATYNAPRFIKSDETTEAPPAPTRRGYTFGGWYTELEGEADSTGCTPVKESSKFTFGSTITDKTTLHAKWTPVATSDYTVVIWRQNLKGDGYDFAESIPLSGATNTNINTVVQQGSGDGAYVKVNGTSYVGVNPGDEYYGFHLKEFDQSVKITPEGDTILNVYYDRNEYTLRFYYARSYNYNMTRGTLNNYIAVGNTDGRGYPDFSLGNQTYYGMANGSYVQLSTDWYGRLSNGQFRYTNAPVYIRQGSITEPGGNRTFVQVNCNNEGFLEGKKANRNLNNSLAYRSSNDYERISGTNTWKDIEIDGDVTSLVSSDFLVQSKATLGTQSINNVTTDVIGINGARVATASVNTTYYYFDIKVRYEQSLNDLWPTPNVAFYPQDMTSYNYAKDTNGYGTISPLLVGSYATGNNISGKYSVMNPELFVGNDKTAYLDIYWRFEPHYEYQYKVYFSTLKGEEATDIYDKNGKGYVYQEDLSYTVANGQGWDNGNNHKADTDTGAGYWDVGTVTFDGTVKAGRVDNQNGTINVYYDRIVRKVIFNDGIYVDGNDKPIQNRKDQQLHVEEVIFGENLDEFNDCYQPSDTSQYVFEGWYLDSEGKQPYTFSGTMPMQDITVYAKWRQVEYRVFLHPNVPESDTTLDWGSESQKMNFRVSYNEKVSAPTGKRSDYEFVGWYTNEDCTAGSLFNAEATALNDITVKTPYNKNVDFTDEMNKYGNGATYNSDITGNNGSDRFWITKKLDLYAKWRAKLTGAQGIGIIYDAGVDGTNPPHDTALYLDQAEATAQAASTAVTTGKVFKYWVVQRWDEAENKYVDVDPGVPGLDSLKVYPGDSFTVLRDYAHKVPNADNTPEHPSYTYTMQLRAEYGDLGEGTPTHIYFYANTQDKDGNAIPSVNPTDQPKDETTYETIDINKAYDILSINDVLNGDTRYSNYTFLGWAKEADATEPWLVLNTDGTYTVTQDNKTYASVTKIAADEKQPYDNLYAVWEKLPDINVYKTVTISEAGTNLGLSVENINTTIYFVIKYARTGDGHVKGETVIGTDGKPLVESVQIVNGVATPAFASFKDVPVGEYEVWEYKAAEVIDDNQLSVGDEFEANGVEFQLSRIQGVSSDGTPGNNAVVTGDGTATVSFTNEYTVPTEYIEFKMNKKWMDRGANRIDAPTNAEVVFGLYKEVDGQTVPVTVKNGEEEVNYTITLDGTVDENGETEAWMADFINLPKYDEHGNQIVYKVKETSCKPAGFRPYENQTMNGQPMGENDFNANNGGTIWNRKLTGTLQLQKHVDFQPHDGESTVAYEQFDDDTVTQQKLHFTVTLPENVTTADLDMTALNALGVTASGERTLSVDLSKFDPQYTLLVLDLPNMPAGTYTFSESGHHGLLDEYGYYLDVTDPLEIGATEEQEGTVSTTATVQLDTSATEPTYYTRIQNKYRRVVGKVTTFTKTVAGLSPAEWDLYKTKFNQLTFAIMNSENKYYAGNLDAPYWDVENKEYIKYRWVDSLTDSRVVKIPVNLNNYVYSAEDGTYTAEAQFNNCPELRPGTYTLVEIEAQEGGNAQISGYDLAVSENTLTVERKMQRDPDTGKLKEVAIYPGKATNTYTKRKTDVTVTKTFSGITADQIPSGFKITNNYETTKEFSLANGTASADGLTYTWTLEDVPVGQEVAFTESGYNVTGYDWKGNAESDVTKSLTTSESGTNTVTFTNPYERSKAIVRLFKYDMVNPSQGLAAEFALYAESDIVDGKPKTGAQAKATFTTANDGYSSTNEIAAGTYYLFETVTPDGYNTMVYPWVVTVDPGPLTHENVITITENGAAKTGVVDGPEASVYTINVPNNPGVILPHTGGPGTALYSILGTALIAGALMYGMVSRRTRERRSDA